MRWFLIIAGVLVGAVALVALIGAMLPRDHVASMRARVAAPPDRVWAVLTDVSGYPAWRPGVTAVDVLSSAPLSWREHTKQGDLTLSVETSEPPRSMVARIKDEGEPFGGAWEYQLIAAADEPGKTDVTITERGWVSNPIFRFVSRYVIGQYSTLDDYLRALSRKFGSEAVPARI